MHICGEIMSTVKKPYVIVFGNEKGGTGKSTAAMHVMVYLLRAGFSVGCVDIDARQGTISRYIKNREAYIALHGFNIPVPGFKAVNKSTFNLVDENEEDEKERLEKTLDEFQIYDFIVMDTPGNDTYLSRLAHSYADTIVTPLNDSFVDLDMLVRLEGDKTDSLRPSLYAEMIWEQKKVRLGRNRESIDWIVMRNRLSNIIAKNKEEMHRVLQALSKRIGFRLADGFSERVIFRELFLKGLTLMDLNDVGIPLSMSHIAARQEVRNLLSLLNLPHLEEKLEIA